MLLGFTEFTKIYLQIKDNPWPYVNLVKLAQNMGMADGAVIELLRIPNGHLPWVRLEYDRLTTKLSSLKAEIHNSVRIYQDFCDKNLDMNKRINELQVTINESETKKVELQNTVTGLKQQLSELQDANTENDNLYDENGMSHCSPVSSLPDDSDHQYPSWQCKSTKALIGF